MAKYTMEIRTLCEILSQKNKHPEYNIDAVIENSYRKIFDFNFPFYDQYEKEQLQKRILLHYYMREIGFETEQLFLLNLKDTMQRIMPRYSKLYRTAKIDYDPFNEVDYTTETTTNDEMVGTTKTATDTKTYNLFSDTPQGALTGLDNETYLTEATKNTAEGNSNGNTKTVGNGKSKTHVTGKQSTIDRASLMEKYRNALIDIDSMLYRELDELFMKLW